METGYRRRNRLRLLSVAAVVGFGLSGVAFGITDTWNAHTNTSWDTVSVDWASGGANTSFSNGNDVVFGNTGAGTITVQSAGVSPNSTTFNPTGGLGTYTFVGGGINGTDTLSVAASTSLTLDNSNGYSGNTTINFGSLTLATALSTTGVAGSVGSSNVSVNAAGGGAALDTTAGFTVDATNLTGSGTVTTTRASSLSLTDISANFIGSPNVNTVEQITNNLTAGSGCDYVNLTPNATSSMTLSFGGAADSTGGVLIFRGGSLGTAPGNGVASVFFTTPPTLIGGTLGTTAAGIVPWMLGGTSTTDAGSQFLTYDSSVNGVGLRPLTSSEQTPLTSAISGTPNATIAAATTLSAPTTINSLEFTASAGKLTFGSNTLTVQSGAVLVPSTISGGTFGSSGDTGAILFGTSAQQAPGYISNVSGGTLYVYDAFTTSQGLTLDGGNGGFDLYESSANLIGTITLSAVGGVQDTVYCSNASALGASSNPIVLNSKAYLQAGVNLTRSGTISINGGNSALDANGHTITVQADVFNPTNANFQTGNNSGGTVSFQGTSNTLGSFTVFNGESDFTPGGTIGGSGSLSATTFNLGSRYSTTKASLFTLNGGTMTVTTLNANSTGNATGAGSIYFAGFVFNAGTLNTSGSSFLVANQTPSDINTAASETAAAGAGAPLTVGDGTDNAVLNLVGGTHTFYTLNSAGTGSISGGGTLIVNTNASLTGTGTIVGTTSVLGNVAPGSTSTPGKLTFTGNTAFAGSAPTLTLKLGTATTPGTTYDQVAVLTGSYTLNLGTADLQVIQLSGAMDGNTYTIITAAGTSTLAGTFANLSNGGSGNDYYGSSGGATYYVVYGSSADTLTITAVPEPMSIGSLLAVGSMAALRRRRRSATPHIRENGSGEME